MNEICCHCLDGNHRPYDHDPECFCECSNNETQEEM